MEPRRKDQATAAAVEWVTNANQLPSAAVDSVRELAKLCSLAKDAGQAARARLAGHVGATYLASDAAAAGVAVWNLYDFSKYLAKDLRPEDRAAWPTGSSRPTPPARSP